MVSDAPTVAIVGAGPAGIAAAVAIARHGGRALLIEKSDTVGGAATNAMVGTICGLSRCSPTLTTPPQCELPGFAREFTSRLLESSHYLFTRNDSGLTFLPYSPKDFERTALEFLSSSKINLCLSSTFSSLTLCEDLKFTLELQNQVHCCDAVIDCSGDAVALQALGLQVEVPLQYQAAAQVFELDGLPKVPESTLAYLVRKRLREAVHTLELSERCSLVSTVPGSMRGGSALFKLAVEYPPQGEEIHLGPPHWDSRLRQQAASDISDLVKVLKSSDPDFSSVALSSLAPALGVRSGRRGVGRVKLTEEAVLHSLASPDGVALGFWPIELWKTPIRPEILFPEQGSHYEIPLGALCSHQQHGVYFAGRCIAASDTAVASARVMGTCLATGYAAGRAAVGFARNETPNTIVAALRQEQIAPFYESNLPGGLR